MAGEGNHHILGIGAAQRQCSGEVLDSGRCERHRHISANRSSRTADDRRVNGEHSVGVIEGEGHITRQGCTEYLKGLLGAGGHHHVATVDGITCYRDGGVGDRAFHEPETCGAVLIDDHLGHGFAQIAGIVHDAAAGVHVKFSGRRGTVGELGLAALGPQVGGFVIVGPGVVGIHEGHQLDVFVVGGVAPPAVGIVDDMGDHDALARSITVPTLFLAVLHDEELVLVQVARDAQGLVGRCILLVKHGQRIIGAGLRSDVLNPSHEFLFIGAVARRCKAVIVVASQAHDVPVSHAVVVSTTRIIEVGQAQAVAKLMGKRADAIDGGAIIVATVQLVKDGKVIHQGVSIIGTECTRAAHAIVRGRRQVPVAGPDGLGMIPRSLCLAHAGIDDDHHIAVVVVVGVIGFERYTVGSGQLAGLGHQVAQSLVAVAAAMTAVVFTVM